MLYDTGDMQDVLVCSKRFMARRVTVGKEFLTEFHKLKHIMSFPRSNSCYGQFRRNNKHFI